jgi:hypothetical protein
MPVGKNSINRVASTTKKSSTTTTKKTTTKSPIKVSETVDAELNSKSEAVNATVLTNVSPEVVEKVVGTKKKTKKAAKPKTFFSINDDLPDYLL